MPNRLSPSIFVVVLAAAAALPAAFTLNPNVDPDTWWHLRVGQLVAESGTVPTTDSFSRLGGEQPLPWMAYSWLYELGLFQAYSAGGLSGVMLVRTALCGVSSAAVLGFAAWRVGPTPFGAVAIVLVAVVLMPFARERPWHVTIAFTVVTLYAVTRWREGQGTPTVWGLPAVFALWANLHIQFVFGWLVLGLACVFPGNADRRQLAVLTAACVLATLANPYHVRLIGVVWDYATQTGPLRMVEELAPPELGSVWTWATFCLLGWSAVRVARRRPFDGFAVALLATAFVLSLRMRRDLWFGAVAAVAVWRPMGTSPVPELPRWVAPTVVAATFFVVRSIHVAGFGPSHDFPSAVAGRYPERAVEVVRNRCLPGPLFNPFDWGGYLIWALPDHPVAIDGRTNLYGSARIVRSMNTWAGGPGRDADPDLASANLVIAPTAWPLTGLLRDRPAEWDVAFRDETATVFTRVRR